MNRSFSDGKLRERKALTLPQTKFLHARGKPLESEPVNKLIDYCGQMPSKGNYLIVGQVLSSQVLSRDLPLESEPVNKLIDYCGQVPSKGNYLIIGQVLSVKSFPGTCLWSQPINKLIDNAGHLPSKGNYFLIKKVLSRDQRSKSGMVGEANRSDGRLVGHRTQLNCGGWPIRDSSPGTNSCTEKAR
ncbi:hypothetical protein N7534_007794 [Penicillium rubens]|nr:hypothetical protein N7534_007794 [Penicillium rubens]